MNAEHRATIEAALRHYGRYRADPYRAWFGRSASEQLDLDAKHRVAIDEALTALDELIERGNRIAELEAQLVLVSRELTSTDNADRYYRGFNDGFDHAQAQAKAGFFMPCRR